MAEFIVNIIKKGTVTIVADSDESAEQKLSVILSSDKSSNEEIKWQKGFYVEDIVKNDYE